MTTPKKTADLTGLDIFASKDAPPKEQPKKPADPEPTGRTYTLSVRVDEPRYDRLGLAKLKKRKTGQEIFIEALDLWLRRHGC